MVTEDVAFALFFRPRPRRFDSSRVLTSGNLPSKAKKVLMPGDQPGVEGGVGGWAQVELTDSFIFGMCFSLRLLSYGDGHPSKPHLNLRGKHFLLLFFIICPCL